MLKISQFTFNPLQENTYVISNEKGACCIIDPGCYSEAERKELTDFIDNNKFAPKCLLNTHCHPDHVFGNKFIGAYYDLPLHIHEAEKPVLNMAEKAGKHWGFTFENFEGELVFLTENDEIKLDDDLLKVLFTPGHSPGSIAFYCEKQSFVIGGDVLFRSGIGRTDLPGGDYDTLIGSIRTRLFVLPDNVVVHSGHGTQTTIGYEKRYNPFLS
jgi:hydroxyacylglutathione hydrolase